MLHRAEGEAARQQQDKERALAERKAWAQAKFEQRQEKISRAAEERKKREVAYCQLLEKTRECDSAHAPCCEIGLLAIGGSHCKPLPRNSQLRHHTSTQPGCTPPPGTHSNMLLKAWPQHVPITSQPQ